MDDAVAGWENFFVAQVGASAALTGLLFVAVSINLAKILQLPSLPGRAAETLIGLFVVLGVASFGLVPHVTRRTFGIEILAVWVLACVAVGWIQIRSRRRREAVEWWTIRVVASHTPLFAFLGGGISLLAGRGEGPYWLLEGRCWASRRAPSTPGCCSSRSSAESNRAQGRVAQLRERPRERRLAQRPRGGDPRGRASGLPDRGRDRRPYRRMRKEGRVPASPRRFSEQGDPRRCC